MINSISCTTFEQNEVLAEHVTDFKNHIIANLDENQLYYLLNFKNVEFVDSSFLGALVSVYKKIHAANGVVKITGLQSSVADLLEQTRIFRIFEIYENEQEAIRSFYHTEAV
jgi:anti-sigma B factor antagonist